VDLITDAGVMAYRQDDHEADAVLADGPRGAGARGDRRGRAALSARRLLSDDQQRSSAYLAYRGAAPVSRTSGT
jgi:hypothetical protein